MVQQQDPHESYAGVDTAKQVDTTMKDPLVTEDIADDIKRSVKAKARVLMYLKKLSHCPMSLNGQYLLGLLLLVVLLDTN
jgi:hypothetical protein